MALSDKTLLRILRPVTHLALALPLGWLVFQWVLAVTGQPHDLGFLPQETSNRFSGDWALRILLIGLAVTPLAKLINRNWPIQLRRAVGLWSFAYVVVHLTSFVWLDKGLNLKGLWEDIVERPYITVGTAALLLLIPLAWTSRKASIKTMGYKAWKRLHTLVYPAGVLAVIHFIMMRRGFQIEPLVYAAILATLLALRFMPSRKRGTVRGWAREKLGMDQRAAAE